MAVSGAASRRRRRRARPIPAGRPASPTARPTAARSSRASPTRWRPGSDFSWFRSRILGGRTNHYGRVTLRMADYDFKPKIDRRPRLRLADQLRGHGAVLRQGGALHRRHRHGRRHPQRAGRHLQSAGALQGARRADPELLREARDPRRVVAPGGHDRRAQRPAAVPLLRPVRPRLHDGVELRRELRADLPGDEDRARCRSRQRDGARADHRRQRQGDGGLLHRQDDRHASSRCAAARSCSRRAPASRRGCCSIRSRRGIRRGSRTRRARSAAI